MSTTQLVLLGKEESAADALYMSFELSDKKWQLTLSDGRRGPSRYSVEAGDTDAVLHCLGKARERCKLEPHCKVHSHSPSVAKNGKRSPNENASLFVCRGHFMNGGRKLREQGGSDCRPDSPPRCFLRPYGAGCVMAFICSVSAVCANSRLFADAPVFIATSVLPSMTPSK